MQLCAERTPATALVRPIGTMYVLVMVDANAQTVILGWAYFADTEADWTWESFLEEVSNVLSLQTFVASW